LGSVVFFAAVAFMSLISLSTASRVLVEGCEILRAIQLDAELPKKSM
jgi:hypothetical protein